MTTAEIHVGDTAQCLLRVIRAGVAAAVVIMTTVAIRAAAMIITVALERVCNSALAAK